MNAILNPQDYSDCMILLRLHQAVNQLASQRGHDGDPLADPVPQPRSESDLFAAGDLLLSLSHHLKHGNRELARRMCNAVVFGSSRKPEWSAVQNPEPVATKLERERRRTRAGRCSR